MDFNIIKTEAELIQYIKEELGWPQLNVELTDVQFHHCIDKAIQMFANFALDGEIKKYVVFNCEARGQYLIDPIVEEITRVARYANSFSADLNGGYVDQNLSSYVYNSVGNGISFLIQYSNTRAMIDKWMTPGIDYEFNKFKGIFYCYQDYSGPLLLECWCKYVPDAVDKIFNQEWVRAMSVAQARLMQSMILGKYSHSIINGAQINYADIRSRAETEIQELKDELKRKWMDSAPVLVG